MTLFRILTALIIVLAAPAAWAAPVERFVDVGGGVRLHAISEGRPSAKPALVFVTGWRVTKDVWRPQMAAFAKDRLVLAFDPRAQGRSTITAEGVTPEQRARDLAALLDAYGLRSIVLVGWSQGAQDLAAFIQQEGAGRLAGVVFVDAPVASGTAAVRTSPEAAAQLLDMIALSQRAPRAYIEGMLGAIITRKLPPAELAAITDQAMKTPAAIGAAMLVSDLLGPDRTGALARLDKPALVIAAGRSPELEAQRAMAGKLAKGRFEVVEGAAHAVFIDEPERFDALLASFLAGLPQPSAQARDRPPAPADKAARTGPAPGRSG
jgi:microsomal epoxide hydrolase